jgi:RNA polymerase sigma-70 factor (ECF subfamily)
MTTTDHELMELSRQGNAAAFAELVRRWEDRIGAFVARLIGVGPEVEDVCQEVFVRVLVARERYRPDGAFSTWLYRIALNASRDSKRRAKLRAMQPLDDVEPSARTPTADQVAGARELERLVEAALDALAPELSEVLVLKHFGKLSFAETADVLGLPVSTVKSRMQQALDKLRGELRRRGVGERELER